MAVRAGAVAVQIAVLLAGAALLAWAAVASPHWFERHVLRYYAFSGPAEVLLAWLARGLAAMLGLVLLVFLPARARRWAERFAARTLAGVGWRIGLAVLAALALGELALRWRLGPPPAPAAFPLPLDPRDLALAQHDRRLGWVLIPSRTTLQSIGGRTIRFATTADGNRARSQEETVDPERPTLLFTGESIAVGHGLEWAETYPALVGARLGVQVVNLAVPAYGTDQALARLADTLPRLRQPLATVNLFVAPQLERNRWDFRPRIGLAENGTLTELPPASGRLHWLRLYGLLRAEFPYHDDRALPLTRALLRATAARTRAYGARPLFVMMRWAPAARYEDWLVRALFEPERLEVVRVDVDPSWRIPADGHPDARAMPALADAIVAALRQSSRAERPDSQN